MNEITITTLAAEEINALSLFASRVWRAHYSNVPQAGGALLDHMLGTLQSPAAIAADITERGCRYFVAKSDGKILGYSAGYVEGADLHLSKLYVDLPLQGKGLGRRLLDRVIAELGSGCTRVLAYCNHHNTESLNAYARMGFSKVDKIDRDFGGGHRACDYLLSRPLTNMLESLDIRAVLFDMDGLLYDSERLYQMAWPTVLAEMGYTVEAGIAEKTVGAGKFECETLFKRHCGEDFCIDTALLRMEDWLVDHIEAHGVPLMPGVRQMLDALVESGIPCAIGTSNVLSVAEHYLETTGIDHYFDAVICGDMVDEIKPAPDIFLRGAKELGLPPERCLVLDDTSFGILAASRAGCIPGMVPDVVQPDEAIYPHVWRVFSSLDDVRFALFPNA